MRPDSRKVNTFCGFDGLMRPDLLEERMHCVGQADTRGLTCWKSECIVWHAAFVWIQAQS